MNKNFKVPFQLNTNKFESKLLKYEWRAKKIEKPPLKSQLSQSGQGLKMACVT